LGRFRKRDRDDRGQDSEFEEVVVKVNRCSTVVKGGRRFSFSALVVVGDRGGNVGVGFGKANGVPEAVEKGVKEARANLEPVSLAGDTIPHAVVGKYSSSKVLMVPASAGTGVIAGATVRSVLDLCGVKNILTKSVGSHNPVNLVKATMNGLRLLRTAQHTASLRGVEVAQ
jgi:small subunit ribosomal protein S5